MSLAFYAAPINSNNDNNDNSGDSSVIDRKRSARASHNKTVKRYSGSDSKIETMKKQIGFDSMDNNSDNTVSYTHLTLPTSSVV